MSGRGRLQPPPVRELVRHGRRAHRPPAGGDLDGVTRTGDRGVAVGAGEQRAGLVDQTDRQHEPAGPVGGHGHDREPVPVGGDHVHRVAGRVEQDAVQGRQGGVGADGVADRVEGGGELGGGDGQRHGGLRSVEESTDRGELPAGGGQAVLEPSQVRVEHRPRVGAGQQRAHRVQRHPDPAQPGDEASGRDLGRCVPPVARARVHRRRHQHAGAVVEPQRADRQPGQPGDRADRQQGVLHAGGLWSLDPLEGQRPDRARTSSTLARHTSSQSVGARPSSRSVALESSTNGRTNW